MAARRALVVLIVLLTAGGLGLLLFHVLAPGGWTLPKLVMLAAFLATAPWTGLCLANGLIGFLILTLCRDPVRAVFPPPPRLPDQVQGRRCPALREPAGSRWGRRRLRRRLWSRSATRTCAACCRRCGTCCTTSTPPAPAMRSALFILSDTPDPRVAATEQQAVAAFRAEDRDPARIHYRRRTANTGFKAGNIMDFLDRHADGFELMLTLDADFRMSAAARAAAGADHPGRPLAGDRAASDGGSAGIVAPSRGCSSSACAPGCGPGPPDRPGGRATRAPTGATTPSSASPRSARTAGCRCCPTAATSCRTIRSRPRCWAAPAGAFACCRRRMAHGRRTRRPCRNSSAANCAGWRATCNTGISAASLDLRPMGRWQLMQAILLFAGAPLYLLFLLAAAVAAATDPISPFPRFRRWLSPSPGSARSMRPSCWAMPRWRCRLKSAPAMAGMARFAGGRGRGIRLHAAVGCRLHGRQDRRHAATGVRRVPAGPRRTATTAASAGARRAAAVATDRPWRAGVLRFRRPVGGDAVGAAVGRRSSAGDPAVCPDRPTAHGPLAAAPADRGDPRGNQPPSGPRTHSRRTRAGASVAGSGRTGLRGDTPC